MAEQLEQSNPELVNSLRQSMQNMRGGNTGQSDDAEDPNKSGNVKFHFNVSSLVFVIVIYRTLWSRSIFRQITMTKAWL